MKFVTMWLPSLCSLTFIMNQAASRWPVGNVANWELHEQVGLGCLVCCFELPSRGPNLLEHQRELDFRVEELLGALPFAKFSWDGSSLNNLYAWTPDSMTRCHFVVHLFNSTVQSSISVFLVHVVITSPALIPQPNPVVLYLGRIFLKNL